MRILAGDIGGTKTDLVLYDHDGTSLDQRRFPSSDYPSLEAVAAEFLGGRRPDAAAFAVAGPVVRGSVKATNLPWHMDELSLRRAIGAPVTLINDLAAVVYGVPYLDRERDLVALTQNEPDPEGPIAVVGAGTGLGEGVGVPSHTGLRVLPSEGGHADFAPRDEVEIELLRFLRKRHARRVSVERAVSGPGLIAIYDFVVSQDLASSKPLAETELMAGDRAEVIGRLGSSGADPACERALDLFVSLYGAEAGNFALKVLPTGGLFIGGGMAPKLIDRLKRGDFMQALVAKGRMTAVLQRIPVSVVMSAQVALIGARAVANVIFNKLSPQPV